MGVGVGGNALGGDVAAVVAGGGAGVRGEGVGGGML